MILVTGATGSVGRPLIDLLTAEGADVRAVTRDAKTAELPAGVEVVEGDPSQPETIRDALRGITAIFLNARAIGTAAGTLVELAREGGATRVVAMSALNVDFEYHRQPSRARGEFNKEAEVAAVESGLDWVALRSGSYALNTINMWAGQIRAGDVVRGPYGEANWAPMHERDLAAVGVHALLTDELLGTRPVLTGPQSLNQEQMVAAIGDAIGRKLRFEEVPAEVAKQGLLRAGIPPMAADGFLAMQAESYGQAGLVTGEVDRILGRPGLTFAQWAADNTAAFRG